ncbi:hypothetical protein Vafri_18998 [Volvox africanus]|uniref:Uncharacterized protein n=1 Tax=Volvox africanus TaxID=51714 RepID=A0A8J4BP74_9CHLO|nr:hypothetical protein Vafri_18998 [Volvox africanus]
MVARCAIVMAAVRALAVALAAAEVMHAGCCQPRRRQYEKPRRQLGPVRGPYPRVRHVAAAGRSRRRRGKKGRFVRKSTGLSGWRQPPVMRTVVRMAAVTRPPTPLPSPSPTGIRPTWLPTGRSCIHRTAVAPYSTGKPEEVLKSIKSMLTDIQATNTQLNPYIPSFIADTLARASKVAPQPIAVTLSSIAGFRPSLRWSTRTSANGRGSIAAAAALAVQTSNAWAANRPLDVGGGESEGDGGGGGESEGGGGGGGGGGNDNGTDTASREPCISSLVHLAKELQPLHWHVMRTRTRRGSSPGVPPSAVAAADPGGDDGGGTAGSHTSRFRKGPGGLSPSLSRQREQLQPPGGGGGGGGGGSGRDFGGDFGATFTGDEGRVDYNQCGANSSGRSLPNRDISPRLSSSSPGASRRCSTDGAPAAAAAPGPASGFRSPQPPVSLATPTGSAASSPPRGPAFCYDIPSQPSGPLWSKLPSPDPLSKSPFHHQNWSTNGVVLRPGSALLRAGVSSPTRTPPTSPVPWLGPPERRH